MRIGSYSKINAAVATRWTAYCLARSGTNPSDTWSIVCIDEYVTFDSGTDPGDDVTIYLIESSSGLNGYLILSDSFHTDLRKAAFIDVLVAKRRVNG